MIWITGDLHGGVTAWHISTANFKPAKRGDICLCCGDFGAVWYNDCRTNEKHRREEDYFLESQLRQRVTWLACDGNHENFGRLFSGEFPLVDLYGGKAYKIRNNVYYLKRGEVFEIEGKTFLAFGGAASNDKDPGWVYPTLSTGFGAFGGGREWSKGRTEGKDWWPEEVPSREDFENACRNLDHVGWKVDYVISHTCPVSERILFGGSGRSADPTETMLQELLDRGLEFGAWHFGHFHEEKKVDKFVCHYNKVEPLGGGIYIGEVTTPINEI